MFYHRGHRQPKETKRAASACGGGLPSLRLSAGVNMDGAQMGLAAGAQPTHGEPACAPPHPRGLAGSQKSSFPVLGF